MNYVKFFRLAKTTIFALNFPRWSANCFSKIVTNKENICVRNNILKSMRYANNVSFSFAYTLSFFGLFRSTDDDTPEDKLITTIKRSILCIQQQQHDKAEQMLHLALRMAQDLQSKDGITYVYDVMANLAMEREQFIKAEALFVDVMKRLLNDGVSDDDPKILHISSKLAHIAELSGDIEKARTGFMWTLAKLENCKKEIPDDNNLKELWALTINWFGQLLMKENNFKEAEKCFKDAYDSFVQINGSANEEAVIILNNLSVACTNMNHFDDAKRYLETALDTVKNLKDVSQEGILLANLGLIYLQEGLISEAKTCCSQAWKTGKAERNNAAIEQAEYCLNEIKTYAKA